MKTAHGWTNFGSITTTDTPVTEDLPATGGTPHTVDLTTDTTTKAMNIIVEADAYCAWADTTANAVTNIAADATRIRLKAGAYTIPVSSFQGGLAFKSQGAAQTDGLGYYKVKG